MVLAAQSDALVIAAGDEIRPVGAPLRRGFSHTNSVSLQVMILCQEMTSQHPPPESSDSQARPDSLLGLKARPDLALLYEQIRLRIMGIGVVTAIVVGIITGWPSGPFVLLAVLGVFSHALYLRVSATAPSGMTLMIDGVGLALASLTMSIPVVTATAFCFYAVVASILVSGRHIKWVVLFTISWIAVSLLWMERNFRTPYEDDVRVIIEVSTVVFFAAAITFIVAMVIARLRQTEQERGAAIAALRESNSRLEDLVAAKDRFVASVSHELRTPLTAVVGLAQELSSPSADLAGSELEELHELITNQAQEVARIVEDLLVAARADIGEVTVFPEPIAVAELVADLIDSIPEVQRLTLTVTGEATAYADPVRVNQIIRNLLINACRYGGDEARITIRPLGELSAIDVADNGSGIADTDVQRVFEPYQTAHDQDRQTQSVGLGLAVSRTLARLMEGELSYERQGEWTVFTLLLPTEPQ